MTDGAGADVALETVGGKGRPGPGGFSNLALHWQLR